MCERQTRQLSLQLDCSPINHDATRLLPCLMISAEAFSADESAMSCVGVRCIVNCTNSCANSFPESFKYMRVPCKDTVQQNIRQYFHLASAFIDAARKKRKVVLVHCSYGMSRSASIVLAYLMLSKGMVSIIS
jgi:Dual specificity phosphatase, catalytic domain